MSRSRAFGDLARTEMRVAQGQLHLFRQSALILRLELRGYNTSGARLLLRVFRDTQKLFVFHRDKLRAELGQVRAEQRAASSEYRGSSCTAD